MTGERLTRVLFAQLALVACAAPNNSQTLPAAFEAPTAKGEFVVKLGASELTTEKATLTIEHRGVGAPSLELSINAAAKGADTWDLAAWIPTNFFERRTAEDLSIGSTHTMDTFGSTLARTSGSGEFKAASFGQVSLSVDGASLRGSTHDAGLDFDAAFEGPYTLACYVPAKELSDSAHVPPVPTAGGAESLVLDEHHTSEFCERYAKILGAK